MKRFFLTILLIASFSGASADDQSKALLAKVHGKINSVTSYRVNFTSDEMGGVLTVSGSKFVLISSESEVYYDGTTLWNFNKRLNEVNVENLDPNDPNVMMNPSKLLTVSDNDFTHKTLRANVIRLTPKSSATFYSGITLTINASTSIPEIIEISDRETGEIIRIKVSNFTPNVPMSSESFRFDAKKHKGVDVVDFR